MEPILLHINNTATGVVCLCKNNQGNLLTCYFPDIIKQTEPLLKDDVIDITVDVSDSDHIKLSITKSHQESIKAAKNCYELYFNNEIISLPFIDSPGAATIIALTFNKGTLTLDASSSIADDKVSHYHCHQFSPHTKLSIRIN